MENDIDLSTYDTEISYKNYRNEHSFNYVQELVNSLSSKFKENGWANHISDDATSILESVSFDKLQRNGLRTMRETTFVGYKFERPNFKIRLAGMYNSQTGDLEKTTIKINIGEYPENTLVEFEILPSGKIERTLLELSEKSD